MLEKLSIALVLALCLTGAAAASELPAAAPTSADGLGCSAGASLTLATLGIGEVVPTAGGGIVFGDTTPCCYSDPCPGWSGGVSCCEEGCSAYTDRVWCSSTGFIVCPNPCAGNGICYSACGSSDPDCVTSCACEQGIECDQDSQCDPCNRGYGFCDRGEPAAIVGTCSCFF